MASAGTWLPSVFSEVAPLGVALWQWIALLVAAPLAAGIGWATARATASGLARLAAHLHVPGEDALILAARRPLRYLVALAAWVVLADFAGLPAGARTALADAERIVFIALSAWLLVRLIGFAAGLAGTVYEARAEGEARVRAVRTQVEFLHRLASVLVVMLAVALILMQFEVVRTVGVSLVASAGVATVLVGFAAQKSLGGLLAGIQLSITQPIRIGDTVTLEGEFGTVEEITLTYVVVRIWDLRRLVVPITYFLDKPFQNWSRVSADLMGSVELFVDYGVPVGQVRAELERVVQANPKWDGKVCALQVTDVTDRSMKLRALVSSMDPSKNWDLRCDVREALITYLQQLESGKYLPRTRVEGDFPLPGGGG